MNNSPFTAIKLGEEEEDVFATAFGKVNSISGMKHEWTNSGKVSKILESNLFSSSAKISRESLGVSWSPPMLETYQAVETSLDMVAQGNHSSIGLRSQSWQLMHDWDSSLPVPHGLRQLKGTHSLSNLDDLNRKADVSIAVSTLHPSVQPHSLSDPKSPSSPSKLKASPNQRTKPIQRRRRKKPPVSTEESCAIRARFLQRNRLAAGTCRQKRKDWIISLEEELKRQSSIAMLLQTDYEDLMDQVKALRKLARMHTECGLNDTIYPNVV